MEITLGPVLFDWGRERLLAFYEEVASMAVDVVYVGEVVCTKRRGLSPDDIMGVGGRLVSAGKRVYVSTPAVVSNDEELARVRALAELPFPMEANDVSALSIGRGRAMAAGPHLLAYNAEDTRYLMGLGARRATFPVELSADSVAHNIRETGIIGEVFAHGRVPLAFSWRCYAARANGRTRANCAHDCAAHDEGMVLMNLDGIPVFAVNGASILSADTYTLVDRTAELLAMGVSAMRISPHPAHTATVVDIFRRRLDGAITAEEALLAVSTLAGEGRLCNGWYVGRAGRDFIRDVAGEGLQNNGGGL